MKNTLLLFPIVAFLCMFYLYHAKVVKMTHLI